MAKMAPNDLLEALCAGSHPRKQQSVRLIYRLCEEQHDRGSSDFSIATIGCLSAAADGPSAAAIRNKTGDDYKALITSYAEAVGGKAKKVTARKGSILDEILEDVSAPVLRTRVGILLAELESARGQLTALRHLAGQTAVLRLVFMIHGTYKIRAEPRSPVSSRVAKKARSDVRIGALKRIYIVEFPCQAGF
ncbi:hypothetical protein HAV22_03305 [Massilia sp. TW-1]|uniref:Uncharacterized protein n=1 Tax=Telluria antibiotica TaxID=2717319 RepID=A0ABX0P630_9BURK|nr:gamma-mobile-trio protein GmtX [Telluria antibiotica]NIA52684.1 hypothetical protein [Telluria antibiotica]